MSEILLSPSSIIHVYDGDTFSINLENVPAVFGDNLSVRIFGIDTAEIKSTRKDLEARDREKVKAKESRDYLESRLLSATCITLTNLQRDKYFRLLATVLIDGIDIAGEMVFFGLAVRYYGGTKTTDWGA